MDKWTYTILNIMFFMPSILMFIFYRRILLKKCKFILISGFIGVIYFFIVDIFATNWKAWEFYYIKTFNITFGKSVLEELIWVILVWMTIAILIEIYFKRKKLYDDLYSARENNILWGQQPGRLVKNIQSYINKGKVLDIGCGDGKNAIFLEKLGFDVIGYDCSILALEGLKNRFKKESMTVRGIYHVLDIEKELPNETFDVVVSYGLFHCLDPKKRVYLHKKIQELVCPGGFLFFTCLTDELFLPKEHGTDHIFLVNKNEIEEITKSWNILYKEIGVIMEDHLPIVGEHKHSAIWIIAQKPNIK